MPNNMPTIEVETLPVCDVCKTQGYQPPRTAKYDSSLDQYNTWGYTCTTHFREFGRKGTATIMKLAS